MQLGPVTTIVGMPGTSFMVTELVVALQFVTVLVKVNVVFPDEIPVTTPALVTVAIAVSLLIHVPPVVGDSVIVLPIQTDAPAFTVGIALTTRVAGLEIIPFISEMI